MFFFRSSSSSPSFVFIFFSLFFQFGFFSTDETWRILHGSSNTSDPLEVDGEVEGRQPPVDVEVTTEKAEGGAEDGDRGHTFDINPQPEDHRPRHFEVVSLSWHHVQTPYTVSVWILLASIAKILFHVHKKFGESIPDSALLIVVGLVLGYGLHQLHVTIDLFNLKSTTFFLYLLPPIIFDAGYFMPSRQLFENWESVLLFAFVGTIWNTLAIGLSLFLIGHFQLFSVPFSAFEILLFASLISAVDPVAVIAVFEEIHINEFLFINVFGEALFNDGVSVVLYHMFRKFTLIGVDHLSALDYLAGIGSFVVIALGGTLIGLLFAFLVSILTRFTGRVKILAPVFVFVVPYLSYLTAEMFGLSSILAIVACGITMKQYVKGNMSHDANSSVKYFVKMLAQCSETAIFMFLGLSTIASKHHWDTLFVAITIVCCLIYRTIGVLVQCAFLNRFRHKKFSFTDQFVLSYGGLRGAIAFGLVVPLPAAIHAKQMFVTTCIAVIYFTVFLQGITIRPLLHLLKVEKQDLEYEEMMVEKVYNKYVDYTMAGIEDIIGQKGKHFFRDSFERFNAKVLKPLLMRNVTRKTFDASDIVRAYNKITLQEAVKITQIGRKIRKTEQRPYTISIASAYRDTMNGRTVGNGGSRTGSLSKKDMEQYMSNEENAEVLYTMFSRLLDRKIEELRRAQETRKSSDNDDIKDNYMDILHTNSSPQLHNGGLRRMSNQPTGVEVVGGGREVAATQPRGPRPMARNKSQPTLGMVTTRSERRKSWEKEEGMEMDEGRRVREGMEEEDEETREGKGRESMTMKKEEKETGEGRGRERMMKGKEEEEEKKEEGMDEGRRREGMTKRKKEEERDEGGGREEIKKDNAENEEEINRRGK